ncbi:hypothetical protein AAVH_32786, partial [Aphelenchoides avenae]
MSEYWSSRITAPLKHLHDYCDISEESLLEFCFGSHLSFTDAKKPVVSLWLDWMNLSDQFLNRFIK